MSTRTLKIAKHIANERSQSIRFYPLSYNQERVIEQTVLSALTQDYDNLEVVVSDDASPDPTPQLLRELQEQYPERLKVFLHQN